MFSSLLTLLLLIPSFALIALVAWVTGFYFSAPPTGMASLLMIYPAYGNIIAIVMMLAAGWLCAAGGGMQWTRLRKPSLSVVWFLLMMAMMKVGIHVYFLWGEPSVSASRFALLMGGIVAPITCQLLLLISTFTNGSHRQPGSRSSMRTVVSLAAMMAISLAIGATTLFVKTS